MSNFFGVHAVQVHIKYFPHDVGFFFIDNKLTTYKVIAQRGTVGAELLTLYPFLVAPAYIAGDGLALCLREGCIQGGHQFGRHPRRIDIFFLEEDSRSVGTELSNGFQTLRRVAGEARDGLDQNAVNESASAVGQHPLEVISLLHGGAGDTLVGVDVHQPPIIMLGDVLRIVDVLGREGVELIL